MIIMMMIPRQPQDEDGDELADLQPQPHRPDQHRLQQHLQLHLHEEQVKKSKYFEIEDPWCFRDWIFGLVFCRLTAFMTHLSIVASVLTMAAIAGERWSFCKNKKTNKDDEELQEGGSDQRYGVYKCTMCTMFIAHPVKGCLYKK